MKYILVEVLAIIDMYSGNRNLACINVEGNILFFSPDMVYIACNKNGYVLTHVREIEDGHDKYIIHKLPKLNPTDEDDLRVGMWLSESVTQYRSSDKEEFSLHFLGGLDCRVSRLTFSDILSRRDLAYATTSGIASISNLPTKSTIKISVTSANARVMKRKNIKK